MRGAAARTGRFHGAWPLALILAAATSLHPVIAAPAPDGPEPRLATRLAGFWPDGPHGTVEDAPRWARQAARQVEAPPGFLDAVASSLTSALPAGGESRLPDRMQIERGFRKAARTAIKSYLIRETGEDTPLASVLYARSRSSPESSSSGSRDGRVRLRVGVSHLTPKVEIRSSAGGGALGLSFAATGKLALDFATGGQAPLVFRVDYDRESGTCGFAARVPL